MEAAVVRTKEELSQLNNQIASLLDKLISNKDLVQVGVEPLFGMPKKKIHPQPPGASTSIISRKRSGIDADLDDCNDENRIRCKNKDSTMSRSKEVNRHHDFTIVESETFLIPLLNRWVWGITLVNSSGIPQSLPELHLTLSQGSRKSYPKSTTSFSYSYVSSLIDMDWSVIDALRPSDSSYSTIPFYQTFLSNTELRTLCGQQDVTRNTHVQPECKVYLCACFENPLKYENDKVTLLATVLTNGKQQFTKSISIEPAHAYTLYNDDRFQKFKNQIFMGISQNSNSFKLERRHFGHREKSPFIAFQKFLTGIGFGSDGLEVKTGVDTSVRFFTFTSPSLLYGLMVKVESCSREASAIKCRLFSRTTTQKVLFNKLFTNWLKTETQQEKKLGLRGITVLPITLPELSGTLQNEFEMLNHLFILTHERMINPGVSANWLKRFIHSTIKTDILFTRSRSTKARI